MSSDNQERSTILGILPDGWMPFLLRAFLTVYGWTTRLSRQLRLSWTALMESFEPRAVKFYNVTTSSCVGSSCATYQPHSGILRSSPLYPLGICEWYYMLDDRLFLSSRAMETTATYSLDVIGCSLHYTTNNEMVFDMSEWISDVEVTSQEPNTIPPPQVLVGGFLLETGQTLWGPPSDYILRLTTLEGEQVWSLATNQQTIDISALSDSEEDGGEREELEEGELR